mgnify:FL=1
MTQSQNHIDQIFIKIGGSDLSPTMMNLLYSAEVENSLHMPSMFTLRFNDDDFDMIDDENIEVGKTVEISMGRGSQVPRIFRGEITALEPEFNEDAVAMLVVRGYDVRHRLLMTHTQTFLNVTDGDIVKRVVSAAGIVAGKLGPTTAVRKHVFQDNISDLAFIQTLALRNSFEIWVGDDNKLNFDAPAASDPIELKWRSNLRSFRPRISSVNHVSKVQVRSWNVAMKREIVAESTPGSSIAKIGAKSQATKGTAYSSSTFLEERVPLDSQAEADKLAKSLAEQIGQRFAEAEGIAFGEPKLMPGVTVKISDIGQRFGGQYLVSSTRHIYHARAGYDTHFTIEGNQPRQVADLLTGVSTSDSRWYGAVSAIVTDTKDPDNMNRVKVKFPTLTTEHTSTWARVIAPGAGPERGIQWLPEVNDEVVVIFESGDFNHPYVVGGVWNGKDKPAEQQAVNASKTSIRTLKTRVGHVIRFIDEDSAGHKKGIEIIESGGKIKIVIDGTTQKITILSSGDIAVEATKNLTLKATGNVEITGMQVKVEAQSQLDLKSTGPANLKGAIVNIN